MQMSAQRRDVLAHYSPFAYWNSLVQGTGDLANVGQKALGSFNRYAYWFRLRALKIALQGRLTGKPVFFDAAFGEGFYLEYLVRNGVTNVHGIDLSNHAVKAARRRFPQYVFHQGDISRPRAMFRFSPVYDVVLAIDVLYHITSEQDWKRAVSNLARLVKPGGVLILTDKFPRSGIYQRYSHVRRRSLKMWSRELGCNGLVVSAIIPVFFFMDDPVPNSKRPIIFMIANAPWRIASKLLRISALHTLLQSFIAFLLACLMAPIELTALCLFRRLPNLEMIVCKRVDKNSRRS